MHLLHGNNLVKSKWFHEIFCIYNRNFQPSLKCLALCVFHFRALQFILLVTHPRGGCPLQPTFDMQQIGNRIRLVRKGQQMSQNELSERVGISSNYLCEIERGRRTPSSQILFYISDALNVSTDYLLKGTDCIAHGGFNLQRTNPQVYQLFEQYTIKLAMALADPANQEIDIYKRLL